MNQRIPDDKFKSLFMEGLSALKSDFYKIENTSGIELYRERVFCYELYHQFSLLRMKYAIPEYIKFHGELSKSGHASQVGDICPDFLIHKPGSDDFNIAAIEVKVKLYGGEKHAKDIRTLALLIDTLDYRMAYILQVNYPPQYVIDKLKASEIFMMTIRSLSDKAKNRIKMITKESSVGNIREIALEEFETT